MSDTVSFPTSRTLGKGFKVCRSEAQLRQSKARHEPGFSTTEASLEDARCVHVPIASGPTHRSFTRLAASTSSSLGWYPIMWLHAFPRIPVLTDSLYYLSLYPPENICQLHFDHQFPFEIIDSRSVSFSRNMGVVAEIPLAC